METLFWIVEYKNGEVYFQYHPETLEVTKWKDLDISKIKTIALSPFTKFMEDNINNTPDKIKSIIIPTYKCNIPNFAEPIEPYREQEIKILKYYKCQNCGSVTLTPKFKIVEFDNAKLELLECPHCGAKDSFECAKCKTLIDFADSSTKCEKCGSSLWNLHKNMFPYVVEIRRTKYHLGYKYDDKLFLVTIDENGDTSIDLINKVEQ